MFSFLKTKNYFWKFVLVAGLFYFFGFISHEIQAIAKIASPIWPASGIAVGLLFIFSRNLFPAVFFGCILLEWSTGLPLWAIVIIALGNTIECFVGATILRKILKRHEGAFFEGEISGIFVSGFISAVISAVFGVSALLLANAIAMEQAFTTFVTWFLGDLVGIILMVPAITVFYQIKDLKNNIKDEFLKTIFLFLGISFLTVGYFFVTYEKTIGASTIFLLFPLMYYVVKNYSPLFQRGYFLVVVCGMIYFTILGKGPFTVNSINEALITLDIFILAIVMTGLGLNHLKTNQTLQRTSVVLFSGWMISGVIFYSFFNARLAVENETWDSLKGASINTIEHRFHSYLDALSGGVGLVKSNPNLTNKEWRKYIETINLTSNYPGINGMGIVYPVQRQNLNQFTEQHVKKIVFDFPIHPVGGLSPDDVPKNTSDLFIISHIEPYLTNKPALGLDLGSEVKRRAAAEKSRDEGHPVATDIIYLVQDSMKRPGFLVYFPFYKEGSALDSVEDRRANFLGWVYAPFVTQKFLEGVLGANSNKLDLMVFDGLEAHYHDLTYSSAGINQQIEIQNVLKFRNTKTAHLQLGGRDYLFVIYKNSRYEDVQDFTIGFVGAIGLFLVMAMAFMFSSNFSFRQRAEDLANEKTKELSMKEAVWRTIMESAPVGIFQTDLAGNCIYSNTKWCQIIGYESQDLVMRNWEAIIYADDLVKVNDLLDVENTTRQSIEFRVRNSHGELVWIEAVSSLVINDQGIGTGFVLILVDVTEKKNQLQIIEAERIKLIQTSKMASLGVMAGGVAHEINNPLAIIMGKADRILNAEPSEVNFEFVQKHVRKIEQMTMRIAKIIKGLRSFSRNSDKDPFVEISIQNILEDTLEFCRERFNNHNIGLTVQGDLDLKCMARPTEISQVLLNLLNNSFDAVHDLPEKWVKVIVQDSSDWIRLMVIDSGHGIPKNIADRLMEPFFTTKPVGKGTGLGLSISRGIIEDHHGHFYIDHEHANTCFVIELPKPWSSSQSKSA